MKYMTVAIVASVVMVTAQVQPPTTQQLRFEVESIRPSASQGPSFLSVTGDRFTATNFPVRVLIRNAYRLQPSQLLGAPAWLDDRYDIVAKSPVRITGDAQREMLRTLLADRFRLMAHTETHELPIYALMLNAKDGRLGPRLTLFETDCAAVRARRVPTPLASTPQRPVCDWTGGTGYFVAGGITMSTFAEALSLRVDRPVVDRTGLAGYYELEVSFSTDFVPTNLPPDAPRPDPGAPVLVTALQEQLGLKLEPARGPVEVLVIDSIERRPNPN